MNFSTFKDIVNDLKSKIEGSFIAGVTLISSNDILLNFSHYRKEKLIISLNHKSPFISLIDLKESFSTIMNLTSEILRKEIKEAKIKNINILNNDRIIEFELTKTNDYFELETKYLIIEFIPHRANLILTNQDKKIIYSTHFTDLSATHPIIKNGFYELPESYLVENEDALDLSSFKSVVEKYIEDAKSTRRKDKFSKVVTHINSKIKSLKTNIKKLEKEKELATLKLSYKDYGDYALSCIYDEGLLQEYINEDLIKDYQIDLSIRDNANRYYKLYKKAKSTIEHVDNEILLANDAIKDYSRLKLQLEVGDDEDILEIENTLFPPKVKNNNKKIKSFSPHYVLVDSVKIAYGKTDNQNDELTFKRAKPTYTFLHVKDYSGSHVVIFSDNPSDNLILTACEICLINSKLTSGDIQITKINLRNFYSSYLKLLEI